MKLSLDLKIQETSILSEDNLDKHTEKFINSTLVAGGNNTLEI